MDVSSDSTLPEPRDEWLVRWPVYAAIGGMGTPLYRNGFETPATFTIRGAEGR